MALEKKIISVLSDIPKTKRFGCISIAHTNFNDGYELLGSEVFE
jgi:hypothetical protein|tara:strand:+ start:1015 stop:1146 length:132 start_codon:yes stop_codon:yes gene_type:complete